LKLSALLKLGNMNWKKYWLLPLVYLLLVNELTIQDFAFQEEKKGMAPFELEPFTKHKPQITDALDLNVSGDVFCFQI